MIMIISCSDCCHFATAMLALLHRGEGATLHIACRGAFQVISVDIMLMIIIMIITFTIRCASR